jgi:class 3 adenylate cyclase
MTKQNLYSFFLVSFIVALPFFVFPQVHPDSLLNRWNDKASSDSSRVEAYRAYVERKYLYSRPDSALIKAELLIEFAKANDYPIAAGKGLRLQGIANAIMGRYAQSEELFVEAMGTFEESGDQLGVAHCLKNLARVKNYQGKASEGIDDVKKAMVIFEEYSDQRGILGCLDVLGELYYELNDSEMMLEYAERALAIGEELDDRGQIAKSYSNLGSIYWQRQEYQKSIDYSLRALEVHEELGDVMGIANLRSNLGANYLQLGETQRALENATIALDIYQQFGIKVKIAQTQKNIGTIYADLNDFKKALAYCDASLKIARDIGDIRLENEVCNTLYKIHKRIGNSAKALLYFERRQEILDSLNSIDAAKKLQKMEFEKILLQDSIAQAEEARLIEQAHQDEIRQKNQTRNWTAAAGMFALFLAGGFYSRWRYVRRSRDMISKEKDRSENLLLNILPAEIAKELKEKGRADARDFEMASILFTDFKEFTATSEKLSAKELVNEINTCFKAFDEIIGKYGIEKIKTIGDAYMAAGGLPVPSADSAKKTILAALEMQEFVSKRKAKLDAEGKPGFEMRVGIHTGPVVAGIVGVKKFQYDVWGDTVNTASRMESSGEVGKVNISEATYSLVEGETDLSFQSRGQVEAKGKGMLSMYFVQKS